MNKQLGLLWGISLLITFYLGYSYKSQSSEIIPSSSLSNLTANELLTANKNINTSAVTAAKNRKSNNNSAIKVTLVNINEAIDEIKSILGNGMDMANIAKAYNLVNSFSKQELEQALAQLEDTANKPDNSSLLSLLLSKYAEDNARASLAYIEKHLTSGQSKATITKNVIATWSKKDALSAYGWFISQKKSEGSVANNSMALSPIFTELTKQDFNSAFDKLIDLPSDSRDKYIAVNGMIKAFTTKDEFSYLMDKTNELADRRLKDSVIYSWVKRDPQEAIEWVESVEDRKEKAKLQEKVLTSWIKSEPTAAASWYLGNAEPREKQFYADKVVTKWSWNDPEKALNWLSQQTEIDRDKSTLKLLKSSAFGNTDFAINSLDLLGNEKDKLAVSTRIYRTLERNNPKKAAEFIEKSTVKKALQKKITRYQKYQIDKVKG